MSLGLGVVQGSRRIVANGAMIWRQKVGNGDISGDRERNVLPGHYLAILKKVVYINFNLGAYQKPFQIHFQLALSLW